jgi:hypothetical protein
VPSLPVRSDLASCQLLELLLVGVSLNQLPLDPLSSASSQSGQKKRPFTSFVPPRSISSRISSSRLLCRPRCSRPSLRVRRWVTRRSCPRRLLFGLPCPFFVPARCTQPLRPSSPLCLARPLRGEPLLAAAEGGGHERVRKRSGGAGGSGERGSESAVRRGRYPVAGCSSEEAGFVGLEAEGEAPLPLLERGGGGGLHLQAALVRDKGCRSLASPGCCSCLTASVRSPHA